MRFVLAAWIGLLLPAAALAGDTADIHARLASRVKDPELRDMTERILREMNTDYAGIADLGLKDKGEKFDHARLEITGVLSNDPTEAIEPGLFDQFVKPSFSNPEKLGFMKGFIEDMKRLTNPARALSLDIEDYRQAAAGVMTERATKVLAAYQGKEINEIVAHSWGCELIYAAILNGMMRPPKKLIVVGVPDDDFAKWEELALRTGTAVVWVRAKNDKVASGGADLVKGTGGDVKAAWDKACAGPTRRVICPPHNRAPSVAARVVLKEIPGLVGHGRKEYYDVLKDRHILRGGFLELRAAERARKQAEVIEVQRAAFDAALREARGLVEKAHEQRELSRRDHDERLKITLGELALRSCANPGSVTQAELDRLPRPYDENFYSGKFPSGLEGADGTGYCTEPYLYLGRGAGNGLDAEQLRILSTPTVPVNALIPPPPTAVQPIRSPQIAPAVARIPFESVFPRLKGLAVRACGTAALIPVDKTLTDPSRPYSFSKGLDDQVADSLAAGLGYCEKSLFRRLIDEIRNGRGADINSQWVRDRAAEYSRSQGTPSFDYSPPTGCIPGDNSRRNCIACGNSQCD